MLGAFYQLLEWSCMFSPLRPEQDFALPSHSYTEERTPWKPPTQIESVLTINLSSFMAGMQWGGYQVSIPSRVNS